MEGRAVGKWLAWIAIGLIALALALPGWFVTRTERSVWVTHWGLIYGHACHAPNHEEECSFKSYAADDELEDSTWQAARGGVVTCGVLAIAGLALLMFYAPLSFAADGAVTRRAPRWSVQLAVAGVLVGLVAALVVVTGPPVVLERDQDLRLGYGFSLFLAGSLAALVAVALLRPAPAPS
jgi:hypothetical protein